VTDKGNVPDRMKEIAVDCGLCDVEHAHRNERGIVAHTVSLEAGAGVLPLQIGRAGTGKR